MKHVISINNENANCKIEIRLDDECRNGHEDFAITADFWQVGKPRTDKWWQMGGCFHSEILELRPDLAPFVNLHLSDFNGAPMGVISNGMYYGFPGKYHHKNAGPEALAIYYRIPVDMAKTLCSAGDKLHFHYLVEELGIPERWKAEAARAIAQLEAMTGDKFGSSATKSHFTPLSPEQRAEVQAKIKQGYYSPEQIKFREETEKALKFAAYIGEIKEKAEKEKAKAEKECAVALAIAAATNTDKSNFVFYNHSNTVKLNWLSHKRQFTPEEIERIKAEPGIEGVAVTVESKPL